jgi:fatty-acyl-CoA synthase
MTQGAHTLGRWIRDRARATPDRIAIVHDGSTMSYGQLDERSEGLAAGLLGSGLDRGDLVATLTANSAEHVVVFFACAKAGLGLAPFNWRLAPPELGSQLDDARPALFLVEPEHDRLADDALGAAAVEPRQIELGGDDQRALEVSSGDARRATVEDDDPLLVVYTSGTTGQPKGAVLTHANCFWTNLGFDLASGVARDDVVLQVLPQFHCGGWNVQSLIAWWKGATVVLERSFDAARCLDLIGRKGITAMMGVPANYLFMAQEPGFARADLSTLRTAVVGGAAMPAGLADEWRERGVDIIQGYGLTEAAPNVLVSGKPYPYVEVALRDPETGRLLDGAASGELVVRGPNVFAGYLRRPEETAATFMDGWLLTGDYAERDDEGTYRIQARVKDMYVSGGENVYPAEVESVLQQHDGVADAAVVGVPDDRWGEAGVAFVVLESGAVVSQTALTKWCRERLAHYKVPREVRFVNVLPRSAMNKVLKDELAASLEQEAVA